MNHWHTFIGIDPGLNGCFAIINTGVKPSIEVIDIPTVEISVGKKKRRHIDSHAVFKILRKCAGSGTKVFIEDVWSSPQMGVTSAFNMGFGLGVLHASIAGNMLSMERVRPQAWKKEFSLIGKEKGDSLRLSRELFPSADLSLKKHEGRAEALLIAEYGRRMTDLRHSSE